MKEMTATVFKNNVGKAMKHVAEGGKVIITVRGKPLAVLMGSEGIEKAGPAGETLRPFEEAWRDIEASIQVKKPRFKTWKKASDWARNRK